jgi:drug/metabolite transporter (DMT)-like permease
MTTEVIILALIASGFTAMASVAQRQAAAPAPEKITFSWRLVGYLLHRPVWFLGIASMILGFVFQVEALQRGSLVLVQPIIATELVIVFGVIALHDRHRVHGRDWLSAVGMVIGLGTFLALARPGGGHDHASSSMWVISGLSTFAVAGLLAATAYLPARGRRPSAGRKAALLGIAAAAGFGFVAAVVKELSSHLSQGPAALFSNWSPYVLLLSGAAAMFLASNAFQAGSLAASQPGLTIVDPLVASVLGVILFGERVNHDPLVLLGEFLAVLLVVASVILLSRSPLVQEAETPASKVVPATAGGGARPGGWTPKQHRPAATRSQLSRVRQRRMPRVGANNPGRGISAPQLPLDRVGEPDELRASESDDSLVE